MMIYPLTIGGACILTSILGTYFVKLGKIKKYYDGTLQRFCSNSYNIFNNFISNN